MVHMNFQVIPGRYMLHRWSASAAIANTEPGTHSIRFAVPPTNTLKYNSLCRKMNDLASDACFGDETYEIVSSMVDEAAKRVVAARIQLAMQGGTALKRPNERNKMANRRMLLKVKLMSLSKLLILNKMHVLAA